MNSGAQKNVDSQQLLHEALASCASAQEVQQLLDDLCSPAEISAMAERVLILSYVARGYSYREIASSTGVSVTTIGRVARAYRSGSGYQLLLKNMPKLQKIQSYSDHHPCS